MMELVYTSSSKGVDRGTQGYCTVFCSSSIPPMLKMNLENMSDYSWVYPPHHKDFENNPVNYSFIKVKAADEWLRVISRIGLNGLDYSGRPNKIAHYICLEDDDLDECHGFSPAEIICRQDTFVEHWGESSAYTERDISELLADLSHSAGGYWEEVTGDAGWAAHFVHLYQASIDSQISVIYDSHVNPLKLIAEASLLLSPEEQWDISFSTYFNGTSLNSTCNWRFILRGSKYHESLKSTKNLIDLNDFKGSAPETDLSMDDLSIEGPETTVSQGDFAVSGGDKRNKNRFVNRRASAERTNRSGRDKSGSQKKSILALVAAIIALTALLLGKDFIFGTAQKDVSAEEEKFYNYKVELEDIPPTHELAEFGDFVVSVDTDAFLTALKENKKMALKVFKQKPDKIETNLVSTTQYKVIDNVICKLFLEKIDGEFVQNKEDLIKLRISKDLVVETQAEIDADFIEEFKKNIMKMKVNRVIFDFKTRSME